MRCFSEEIYSAYLDNELNQKGGKDVSDHLKSCQPCRNLVENLKKENLMIKACFRVDLPAVNLIDEVTERIKAIEVLVPSNGTSFSYILYTTLILSCIVFPFLIFHLFSSSIGTFLKIFSFFVSPGSILFDIFFFFIDNILNTSIIDIPTMLIFIVLPTIMIFLWMSLLFKKEYELSL
ncbi:MAG: hypothetical protein AMJ42_06045 [Deltaproteobacteria bacterium DG_8]|nr:MAG: hypothetical protein AMJ42_06045 [Deltaproteobacteria bacterium DG_8]